MTFHQQPLFHLRQSLPWSHLLHPRYLFSRHPHPRFDNPPPIAVPATPPVAVLPPVWVVAPPRLVSPPAEDPALLLSLLQPASIRSEQASNNNCDVDASPATSVSLAILLVIDIVSCFFRAWPPLGLAARKGSSQRTVASNTRHIHVIEVAKSCRVKSQQFDDLRACLARVKTHSGTMQLWQYGTETRAVSGTRKARRGNLSRYTSAAITVNVQAPSHSPRSDLSRQVRRTTFLPQPSTCSKAHFACGT